MAQQDRDVEKIYATDQVVAKLRRLADALERGGGEEEVEFQLKWSVDGAESDDDGSDDEVDV